MTRVLFLCPRQPCPPHRGDQRRVLGLLGELSRVADVTVACFGHGELPFAGVRMLGVTRGALSTARANLRVPRPDLPGQVRLHLDAGLQATVAAELRERRPDVLHITTARLGPYLTSAGGWHRHVDLIDALSLNMATRASGERGPRRAAFRAEAALMARYEARLVAHADSASLVSDGDRTAASGLQSAAVIPNGVDLDVFTFRAPAARPSTDELLFFGNLGYFHNLEPARYIAEEVLPRVRAAVPGATLRLCGARPAAMVQRLAHVPGVTVVGSVESMVEQLHRAAVAIVPMFTGSGMKNKVLEAFATGTPVVTNALGIQGLEGARVGIEYQSAEDADGLAAACVALLRDPGRRQQGALAGRALVEERYTWRTQALALLALYAASRGTDF
ncbi:MAG: glycosyltransferase family 4 protein [Solirubrobacteraceae bacterium]